MDKGYLNRKARKNDTRVLNVQKMASCAAAAVISAADKLYTLASELAAQIGVEHKAHADKRQGRSLHGLGTQLLITP